MNNEVGPPPGGSPLLLGPPILSAKRWVPFRPEYVPLAEPCPAKAASWAAANLKRVRKFVELLGFLWLIVF